MSASCVGAGELEPHARDVQSVGPTRSKLIQKGMIWSPSHGDTAFTVPRFDDYLVRIMAGRDWLE